MYFRRLKDLNISTQLILSFGAMIFFVVFLGLIAVRQSDKIQKEVESLYDHPLQVRVALGQLKVDIANMRLYTRELMLAKTKEEKNKAIEQMNETAFDAKIQLKKVKLQYTGPDADIQRANKSFEIWEKVRAENTYLAMEGRIEEIKLNVQPDGKVGKYRVELLNNLQIIENFAKKTGDENYINSKKLKNRLSLNLLLLVLAIVLIKLLINFLLFKTIKKPIINLKDSILQFNQGDYDVRSHIQTENEFGVLSRSFNQLADNIQQNFELTKKTTQLSDIMMQYEDSHEFFKKLFPVLLQITNAQMGAVYLLSSDKSVYKHYESVGLNDNIQMHEFSKNALEGEFGPVLSTKKIQFIKNIPIDTRYVYNTVSGGLIPREIISIPIVSAGEVVAIISLAGIRKFTDQTIEMINRMHDVLNARIVGVLAYRKLREFSTRLESQNKELEAQKTELDAQSTELKEQNQELEIQKNQLKEMSQLKTNFLSNMSHELRTPLNSVIALAGVLNRRLEGKIPADEYSYLEVIERNGKNLLALINDILDISRIESGKEELDYTQFDFYNLLQDITNMIKPQADQKNIELTFHSGKSPLMIENDMKKCGHILQNLIGNAVKFTDKGSVSVKATYQNKTLFVEVKDTGIGISENNISHIFEEFRQADGSTSRRFGGTGLGLSIALKYARLLGGDIKVESSVGEGSTFIFTLPVHPVSKNLKNDKDKELNLNVKFHDHKIIPETPIGKTILLVEDSEAAIIQLRDILDEVGYNILVAKDGKEALGILKQTIPDAMILDLMMPEVDGFEVLDHIRNFERTAHIPVLILTAKHITKEDLKYLRQNNVHQLVQKGEIKKQELLNNIASMFIKAEETPTVAKQKIQNIDSKPLVLIVEDNPDNLLTVKALLADNFDVICAENGIDGVSMARKFLPNLILLDLSLPEVDGYEAFSQIRKDPALANVPVAALTASALMTDKENILAFGFDAYLAKPIDTTVFYNTINQLLYGI